MNVLQKIFQNSKLQILIITFLTFLAFSSILQNGFLVDDEMFIKNWSQAHNLLNVPALLKGDVPEIHQGVYRPIRSVLYAVYWQIWGANPLGYHLHSIAVHLAVTLLVFLIIRKILQSNMAAFAGGLLFALHPIHTEAITYISASMEMTGAVFFFLSFYLYIKGRERKKFTIYNLQFTISLLFAFLAFFTYEMTLTLPILIILHDFLFRPKNTKYSVLNTRYLPYFLLAVFYFLIRFLVGTGISRGDYLGYSFYHTQLTMAKVYVKYLWLILNPTQISYLHELAPGFESFMTHHSNVQSILSQSIFNFEVIASIGILLGLLIIVVKFWKTYPTISFSIAWFFISLLPVSYIFPQGIALAEKYLYIPSFGFVLLVGVIFSNLKNGKSLVIGNWTLVILVAIATSYGYLTFQRNRDWHDTISFWSKVVAQHPRSALGYYTLGVYYGQAEENSKAEESYKKAIEIQPEFWEAHQNLANIYKSQGNAQLAYEHYQQVLTYNPNIKDTWLVFENNGITLRYPNWWKVKSGNQIIFEGDSGFMAQLEFHSRKTFSYEDWIDEQVTSYGTLANQGLAKIPNVDFAYVRAWNDDNIQKLQFFLFKDNVVLELLVWPADLPAMRVFDQMVSSLEFTD